MIALPDINVLLALAWSNHPHHDAAHRWFSRDAAAGWATCGFTQTGFLRLHGAGHANSFLAGTIASPVTSSGPVRKPAQGRPGWLRSYTCTWESNDHYDGRSCSEGPAERMVGSEASINSMLTPSGAET